MASLYFTEEHESFRQSVRKFIESEVLPYADDWERNERIPREIWTKMGEMGFLGINYPEAYGGTEADFFFSVVFLEEIGRSGYGGFAAAVGVHEYMSVAHISKAGSEALKQKYLRGAISGEMVGALAISEPGGGSDVGAMRTTAVRDGDHYLINGNKTFITNGVYSDFITVACRTGNSGKVSDISLIVVDRNMPGVSANKLDKIGWRSSDTGEIFFENVRVPVSNLVGQEGQGFYYIMDSFQLERLVCAISGVTGADAAIELTLKYLHEREAFGRKLKDYQVIRHQLADLATELEAARQLTHYTCKLHEKGEYAVKESTMAKLLVSELGKRIADECLQFFGGYGYIEDYPIARMYRDARVGTIVAGTSGIMREILAKIMVDEVKYQPAYQEGTNGNSDSRASSHLQQKRPETAAEIVRSLEWRFRPEKAAQFETLVHYDISGAHGGQWTIQVKDGSCTVTEGLHGNPKGTLRTQDSHYEDLELGRSNPQMAVFTGKIRIDNIPEMTTLMKLFQRLF
jgi:alkylation response protein AidB-like acyl-CoA dehydrogenase/putative sterol carrier protein